MKTPMVSYTSETLPPMTPEEREQLRNLALLNDEQIDLSDIPEVTDEQAKGAVRGWEKHPGRAQSREKHAA
jgi:hypothetical protein